MTMIDDGYQHRREQRLTGWRRTTGRAKTGRGKITGRDHIRTNTHIEGADIDIGDQKTQTTTTEEDDDG